MSFDLTAAVNAKRQAAQLFMPDAITITDPGTITVDSSGGTSIASPSSVSVAGRLATTGTQAVINEFGAQIAAEADYIVFLPYGTTIREGWTITTSGNEYTVIAVAKPRTWRLTEKAAVTSSTPIGG